MWPTCPAPAEYLQWEAPSSLDGLLTDPHLGGALQDMSRVVLYPFHSKAYDTFTGGLISASLVPSPEDKVVHLKLDMPAGTMDVYLDPKTHLIVAARAVPRRTLQAMMAGPRQAGTPAVTYCDLTLVTAPATKSMPSDPFPVAPPKGASPAASLQDFYQPPPPKPANLAPDFTVPTLAGDSKVKLSDLRGRVVLLDFWATWCPPCREELPVLQGLYGQFSRHGLVMLAVNQREDRQEARDFLSRQGLDIPVVLDEDGRAAAAYKVTALPTVYLIGKDGAVLQHWTGYNPNGETELRKAIAGALAAPAPPR